MVQYSSEEIQIGKAGQFFCCYKLTIQGFNAWIAPEGLPYDVVVDDNGDLYRIQVKTTALPLRDVGKSKDIYRFDTRKRKGHRARYNINDCDYFAFVSLDIEEIAFIKTKNMISKNGNIKTTMDFKSKFKTKESKCKMIQNYPFTPYKRKEEQYGSA